jgi:glucokinase
MNGAIVGRWSTSTVGIRNPDLIVHLICQGVDALLEQHSSSRAHLCAIAAGAPGITDTEKGIVLATSYLMGWTDVPLGHLLEAALGVPAFVDNDVNMAALGEYMLAQRGVSTISFSLPSGPGSAQVSS